jgi:methionyl-tRNA formyltransferase
VRLVFMGTPDFAIPALRALVRSGHEVATAVTQPDRPRRSRSSPPEPSPVRAEAQALGIPVLAPESVKEPEVVEGLRAIGPEAVIVVAYGQILPPEILTLPPRWCINLHASLLPKYRGAAPVAHAILEGDKVTGVTTMKMDRGLDTGDILLQRECAVGLAETAGELTARLALLGADLLVETLALHERGALEPRKQSPAEATRAPSLKRSDGLIDWSRGAPEIADRVRACHPWPLAFSWLRGEPVSLLRAEVSFGDRSSSGPRPVPGQILEAGETIVVQCQESGRLHILELQFPGRKAMTARDAVNGRLVRVGDIFASPPPR